jgi:hypothetical protein
MGEIADLDRTQVITLIDYMTGIRPTAFCPETGDEYGPPHSPELRAFLISRLGDLTPWGGLGALHNKSSALVLGAFLRKAADAIERECR